MLGNVMRVVLSAKNYSFVAVINVIISPNQEMGGENWGRITVMSTLRLKKVCSFAVFTCQ